MLLLLKQLMRLSNPFRMKLLLLHLDVEVEDEVEVGVDLGWHQLRKLSKNWQLNQKHHK